MTFLQSIILTYPQKNDILQKVIINGLEMGNHVLKSQTPKVYKHKSLNTASFGGFHHSDYQVFLDLISKIGGVDKSGKYLQPEKLQREHILTAAEHAKKFNLDVGNSYRYLKKSCDTLMEKILRIDSLDGKQTLKVNVCSSAKYDRSEGKIIIRFTDDIMPYLAQVKSKFLLYNIKEIANFGSLYTTRFYELIQEYKTTGWMEKSVEDLRDVFATANKFKLYADFKRKTFVHACKEIDHNYPNMNLKFEEKKEGRKVVSLRFTFNKKSKPVGKTNQDNTAIVLTKEDTNQEAQQSSKEATEIKNHISELSGFLGTILCQKDLAVKEQTQEQIRQAQKKLAALTS